MVSPTAVDAGERRGTQGLRACVFTSDIGTLPARQAALLEQLARITGQVPLSELIYLGYRDSARNGQAFRSYQPYVAPDRYRAVRTSNQLRRLIDAGVAPPATAKWALRNAAEGFLELILSVEPDVVLLDVRWAAHLKAKLEREQVAGVYVRGEPVVNAMPRSPSPPEPGRISIVLPTHNGTEYLRQSMSSCLGQTHRDLELIVVDDGSREDVRRIVGEFADPRVRYIRHDVNKGLPAALNTGFRASTGAYLTWTSDDNYYAPDALHRLLRMLQRYPQIDFVYSSMYIVDEAAADEPPKTRSALPPNELHQLNCVGASFLYTRKVYETVGDYDSNAGLVEDYDYWVRVFKQFRMQRLVDPVYFYRYHPQSLTSKHSVAEVARRFELVRRQNGLTPAR